MINIEDLQKKALTQDIDDILEKMDVEKTKNRELLEMYKSSEGEVKKILEKGIKFSLFYKQRSEEILLDKEFVKFQCNNECDRTVVVSDKYGKFRVRCPFVEGTFCLISDKEIKKFHEKEKLNRIFSPFNIPNSFYSIVFEKVNKKYRSRLQEYILSFEEGKKDNLIIIGNIGTGKTSMLYLIIRELLKTEITMKYYTANDLATFIIRENSEELVGMYDDIVMIDDLGREYLPEKESFVLSQLDNFIDLRYREDKTTIITSNLDKQSLSDRYPRIIDRLKEKGIDFQLSSSSMRVLNWRE